MIASRQIDTRYFADFFEKMNAAAMQLQGKVVNLIW